MSYKLTAEMAEEARRCWQDMGKSKNKTTRKQYDYY